MCPIAAWALPGPPQPPTVHTQPPVHQAPQLEEMVRGLGLGHLLVQRAQDRPNSAFSEASRCPRCCQAGLRDRLEAPQTLSGLDLHNPDACR